MQLHSVPLDNGEPNKNCWHSGASWHVHWVTWIRYVISVSIFTTSRTSALFLHVIVFVFGISRTGWFLVGFWTSFVAYLLFSNDDLCRNKNTLSVSASFLLILQRTTVHGFFFACRFFFFLGVSTFLSFMLFVRLFFAMLWCLLSCVLGPSALFVPALHTYELHIYISSSWLEQQFFLELSLFIMNFFQSPSWWYLPSVRCGVCCCMWTHLDRQFFILRHRAPLIFYSTYFGYFFWTIILCGDLVLKTASVEEPVPPSIGVGSFFFFFEPIAGKQQACRTVVHLSASGHSHWILCVLLSMFFSRFFCSHCASTFLTSLSFLIFLKTLIFFSLIVVVRLFLKLYVFFFMSFVSVGKSVSIFSL